jgi:hypothetical protein
VKAEHYAPHPGFGPWVGTWRGKYSENLSTVYKLTKFKKFCVGVKCLVD